ncbi:hypothetical protein Daura_09385 [Dactylosporangium aurantiacum]|uniref:Uncharacterized protein n=1 Tax=Dactylosporangium aurantiacum TaxID=35754 RepID=A0A9Q9IIR0_9ACTN|nr:hypothetical protein [Dactylosporangium aurantiacum]MDG6109506.1 hypothetical protein [Dactylosporangium aurantiacum]UWZ56361.1 hypothetical protein Daura_09385 [Dactylosporangium aurantiacum]
MRMTSEPPAEYVAFVSRHLEPLRRDSVRVVGAEEDADCLYADVLTDVATRWSWLELLRTRLGHEDAADDFLGRVFARRSERYYLAEDGPADDHEIQVTAWRPDEPPPARRVYVSTAVRLAPMLVPKRRSSAFVAGPACEAAIAWWHAYETIRRRRLAYVGFVALALLMALANVTAPPA